MVVIPKFFSAEYNEYAPLCQEYYLDIALERVSHLNKPKSINPKDHKWYNSDWI